MQHEIIYKIVTGCWMLSLFVLSSTAGAAEGSNPWALPQATTNEAWHKRTGQSERADQKKPVSQPQQVWRFVTPEILDSLKRQQTQMQLMPGQRLPGQYRSRPSSSCPVQVEPSPFQQQTVPGSGLVPQGSYYGGYPVWPSSGRAPGLTSGMPYGMNNTNPMYDAPVVSPWGNAADVLYRGESFPKSFPGSVPTMATGEYPRIPSGTIPWVPNEAMGGLLPIPVPSTVEDSYQRENLSGPEDVDNNNVKKSRGNNVFNPFTFLPGDGFR